MFKYFLAKNINFNLINRDAICVSDAISENNPHYHNEIVTVGLEPLVAFYKSLFV